MLLISYQGIFDGQNFDKADTPNQIGSAFNAGYSCMVDVWRVSDKLYLGYYEPLIEVSATYLRGNRFWINAKNTDMQSWLTTQPANHYPNYFWFPDNTESTVVTSSGGQTIVPGTVPINNNSIVFLPERTDRAMFSTVKLKCYGIISNYPTFIRRMRNEGVYY